MKIFALIVIGVFTAGIIGCSPKTPVATPVKYEYQILQEAQLGADYKNIYANINKMGKDGWRLIQIDRQIKRLSGKIEDLRRTPDQEINFYCTSERSFVFERPIK